MIEYFSDKERGPKPRVGEVITAAAWGGIVSLVESLINAGAFGESYPETCPDGAGTIGTNEHSMSLALKGEIPDVEWPLKTTVRVEKGFSYEFEPYAPDTLTIFDLIQFCYRHVAKPIQGRYHEFFGHHHLSFDVDEGREEFRNTINRILARNSLAYELEDDGDIVRLGPVILRESLSRKIFRTGDSTLDGMFEESRLKFLNPDPRVRRESLERLWDAWERIKSLEQPDDKKRSVAQLLDKVCSEPNFRTILEEEARSLTDIGNKFHIRHSEVGQTMITTSAQVDYLFHRLFAFIQLLLSTRN